ncbi:MAG: tetratricopeptide repeat protein [Tannerellaceae bacterium]|nr:tetratricopeptide repeat protein [Tannerellaceae bacterium]
MIEKGSQLTKTILEIEPRNVTAYAYKGSFIAYKMAINKLTTMILGPECIRHINQAYESDSTNIQAITDKANLLFYSPGMFGGNKKEAIRYYEKAISLLEENRETENNWQYLNLLTTLAQQYKSLGKQEAARKTYEKILQIEPDYIWVKDELSPQLKK